MTEIVQREFAVHPLTGETLDLSAAATDELGRFLYEIRDYESRLREAKSLVSREVLKRQDMEAKWTTPAGNYVLTGGSPAAAHKEEFDGEELRAALLELVEAGLLAREAVDAAVKAEVVYKPQRAGITALRRLGGRIAAVINAHAQHTDKPRYVSVEKVG